VVVTSEGILTMENRAVWSKITFPKPFVLTGSDALLPAGDYNLLIEEERLQGLTFDAYRRTGTFLQIADNSRFPGRTELRPVSDADLLQASGTVPIPIANAEKSPRKDT
jgi:hypothetical protein